MIPLFLTFIISVKGSQSDSSVWAPGNLVILLPSTLSFCSPISVPSPSSKLSLFIIFHHRKSVCITFPSTRLGTLTFTNLWNKTIKNSTKTKLNFLKLLQFSPQDDLCSWYLKYKVQSSRFLCNWPLEILITYIKVMCRTLQQILLPDGHFPSNAKWSN